MDPRTFDSLVTAAAQYPSRRMALRLLAAGALGALLPVRAVPGHAAQRPDRDQDGLYDDDEVEVYKTNPDIFDTDGDNVGDGEEIYNRDQGLAGPSDPLVNNNPPPPAADPAPAPAPAPACTHLGGSCASDLPCCGNDPAAYGYNNVICCPDATGAYVCTDISGRFICPDPGVPASGCPVGQTNCGGFCTDLAIDHGNCGTCGNRCSQIGPDYSCMSATCTRVCSPGLTNCGGACFDLMTDANHCGACLNACGSVEEGPGNCRSGVCAYPFLQRSP